MEKAIELLLAVLAVYRVAHFVVGEDGPFHVFAHLRRIAYERFSGSPRTRWIDEGLRCVLCVSFWLSWAVGWALPGRFWLNALGIAGGALVLHFQLYKGGPHA